MSKSKEKLLKIIQSDYFPFFVLLVGMILIHIRIDLNFGDDLFFKQIVKNYNIFEWLKSRYMIWSSRIIIEAIMVTLLGYCISMWKVIDIAMIMLLAISLSKLFCRGNKKNNWILVSMIFIYTFSDMSTAGWAATTINYLWPLALGMYSLAVIKKIYGNKIKFYEYILATLSLLFAANQEQMCAVLLGIYIILIIYFIIKKQRKKFLIFQTILCVISFLFIITCPGNYARKISETGNWFPDYEMLSLINKIELGFSTTAGKVLFQGSLIFVIFSILISIVIFKKYKDKLLYVISMIPLCISIYCSFKPNFSQAITRYGIINFDNFNDLKPYLLIILMGMACLCEIICLYLCFENEYEGSLAMLIILIGFVSRMIMGFSPTIWASIERTFIFMYFSLIIVIVMVYDKIDSFEYKKYMDYFIYLLAVLSFCQQIIKI